MASSLDGGLMIGVEIDSGMDDQTEIRIWVETKITAGNILPNLRNIFS